MGLFSFLKSKFSKKENKTTEEAKTYEKGLEKSRKAFASKLENLSKRYASVNEEYFEELEQILIESDVGVELSLRLIENLLDQAKKEKISEPKAINELLVDAMFVDYATKGESIQNEITFRTDGRQFYWCVASMASARPPASPNWPTVISIRVKKWPLPRAIPSVLAQWNS